MRCVSDQGNIVNDKECNSRARPQGSEECNMGPCVTNWYFTDWSSSVSPGTHRDGESGLFTLTLDTIFHFVLSAVLGAVWPRGAEEGGAVPHPGGSQRGGRRRRLCRG